jgi:catechol-2,3-dioxygenase
MTNSEGRIKGLAEASIRVENLGVMQKFYEQVVGLEVLRQEKDYVFFRIAEGYSGHTQNLALFDASNRTFLEAKSSILSKEGSTLHHIALNVALKDFDSEKLRLEGLGVKVHATEHPWIHLRSLYFADPEGNTLEFVAYDESVR